MVAVAQTLGQAAGSFLRVVSEIGHLIRHAGVRPSRGRERLPRPLSNNSINKTIKTLAAIHEVAVEYGFVDRNVARGRRRLLKEPKPPRTYLQADQDAALLAAAGELDAEARAGDTRPRRALLATLALAGLRIGEALDLRWRQVNLADRSLRVVASKTDTGVRDIDLSPTLTEILSEHRARSARHGATDLSSGRRRGKRDSPSNVRNRYLSSAVDRANAGLERDGADPIGHLTPHSLRRTFASLLLATGADVPYVMAQLGHADPAMTLGVYAKVIASKTDYGAALDDLVGASTWTSLGASEKARKGTGVSGGVR